MPQAFDALSPPFDRLTHAESDELRRSLDIGYFRPGEVIVDRGKTSDQLHIIIKGLVEERSGEEIESTLGVKECFDARALVHGAADSQFVSAEETICYLAPKAVVLDLIHRNPGFAAFFYSEISRKLADFAHRKESEGVESFLRARVQEARFRPAAFIAGDATIEQAGHAMREADNNALFVRDEGRIGIVTGMNLSKAVVLDHLPLDTPVREVAHFDVVSIDAQDFVFEALILMTRHHKRRLAIVSGGAYIGTLEDIDILGLVAGNAQVIAGQIDRAHSVDDLAAAARDIQVQVQRLDRQGIKVEAIAEITSDLNRALFAKLFGMIAPASIRAAGCLMLMGSEGRGEQTVRTDQDNGLLLAQAVDGAELDAFRRDFTAALESFDFPPCPGNVMVRNPQWSQPIDDFIRQIRGWILTPSEESPMNLGIFFDALAVAGNPELVARAKTAFVDMMHGESAYLAQFARAIDQFASASAGMLTTVMASVGVGSDTINIKKSGTFPIVHGVRTMSIECGILETATIRRIDGLVAHRVLGPELGHDLAGALSYFMGLRLRSQLRAMKSGLRDTEAIVRLGELSTRDRDLLRNALRVVKRFREVVHARYNLRMF